MSIRLRNILALLLLISATACNAATLTNTTWIMSGKGIECPDAIAFNNAAYTYFNDCYALGTDGVLERGHYSMNAAELLLSDRTIPAPTNFEYWPINLTKVHINKLTENQLVLRAGTVITTFRRR